jgi:hypothetical protein
MCSVSHDDNYKASIRAFAPQSITGYRDADMNILEITVYSAEIRLTPSPAALPAPDEIEDAVIGSDFL